jgi:hypothetical protein
VMKMFHAVSVTANVNQALALAYRYPRIEAGMLKKQIQTSMTAVVDQATLLRDERMRFAIGVMEENSVQVRAVDEMAAIAGEVRRELRV